MKKYILFVLSLFVAITLNAQCADNGNYWNQSWVSCTTSTNPNSARSNSHWILYEFHESQYIDSTYIWNSNRTGESGWGIKDVVIDYSIDGTTWLELGQYNFPQAPETNNYDGFDGPEFDGVFLKKILITVLSTHDGGACASIAEMQFKIDQTACYGTIDVCGICNGSGETTWYSDADGDGLGNANSSLNACTQPTGYVTDNTDDCDNGNLGWFDIGLLLADNGCTGCHGAGTAGGLDLRNYSTAAMGGNICGTNILTGTTLVDIITIGGYSGCGTPISLPSMNDRTGGQFDAAELAELQAWIDGGAPELCTDYCLPDQAISTTYESGASVELKVSQQIIANNTLMVGSNIVYNAGMEIILQPGFEAKEGTDFLGKIEGCTLNSLNQPTPPSETNSFTGNINEGSNVLHWSTTYKANTCHHILERLDARGENWETIGTRAAINKNGTRTYTFEDEKPLQQSFYRIKTVDCNDNISYSTDLNLERSLSGLDVIAVYPNPVSEILNITYSLAQPGMLNFSIIDITGRVVFQNKIDSTTGNQTVGIDVGNLVDGAYVLVLQQEQQLIHWKFIKA